MGSTQPLELVVSEAGVLRAPVYEPDLALTSISFGGKVTTDANLKVARLLEEPEDPGEGAEGDVYEYFQVNAEDSVLLGLGVVTMRFIVSEEWLAHGKRGPADVRLLRRTKGWDTLPTSQVGRLGRAYAFEAKSSGLSVFAITAVKG